MIKRTVKDHRKAERKKQPLVDIEIAQLESDFMKSEDKKVYDKRFRKWSN